MTTFPPNIDEYTKQLIDQGSWSCEETTDGWIIKTESYSWCCNKAGQSIYHLDKTGAVFKQEKGVGCPSKEEIVNG